jgi:hypothetical protein
MLVVDIGIPTPQNLLQSRGSSIQWGHLSMGNLASVLTQLKKEHERVQEHVAQLAQAILAVERLESRNAIPSHHVTAALAPAKKVMSAATRRKLSLAQKARWAATKPVQPVAIASPTAPTKRTMSAAARKKISLALRARWAKVKSTTKKAA